MIKKEYQKKTEAITPPPALEEETLALMREARDRGVAPQKRPAPKLRFIAPAACAAVLAVAVLITASFAQLYSRRLPTKESTAEADSAYTAERGRSDRSGGLSTNAETEKNAAESIAETPGSIGAYDPASGKTLYDSLADFIADLEQNTAPGYGKNYYNKRGLVIVPAALPDYARFKGLELDPETGNYVYSYVIPDQGSFYLLTCTVSQTFPRTPEALKEALSRVKEEAGDNWYADNAYIWNYGDRLTAVLTEAASGKPVEHGKTMEILKNFRAERCTIDNTVISMKRQEN